jgi:hypothetical protein
MDKVIIDAWERWRVREDDDAYEGRISLWPPNDVASTYERKMAVRPSSKGSDLAPLTGSTSPPPSPLDVVTQRGGRDCPPLPPPRLVYPAVRGGGGPSRIY